MIFNILLKQNHSLILKNNQRWLSSITTNLNLNKRPMNLIEKITQRYVLKEKDNNFQVQCGDYVTIQPNHILTHDNTGAVINKFQSIGITKIYNSKQPIFALDHDVQNKSEANLNKYAKIEAFSKKYGIDFYPAGRGIGHQIMIEEGYALPYTLTVASDSHSNMYGGIGCLGTPLVRTDAAALWATGKTWWQIPPTVLIEFQNQLKPGVTGKDVIISLCGIFKENQVLNHAIEFTGKESIKSLSIDERLAIANMTTEWGALAAVFPCDEITLNWYEQRINQIDNELHPRLNLKLLKQLKENPVLPDPNAIYSKKITLDLASLTPHVSGPNSVNIATPIHELESKKIKINKAYLVSCVNSRLSDLKEAAKILKGKKIHKDVEFYVAAASSLVQQQAEDNGDWQILVDAGAITLPPGCGPCVGLGVGLLKDGEVGISATNRNFKGRMGSRNALAYLASPAVVAASSLKGYICQPDTLSKIDTTIQPKSTIIENLNEENSNNNNNVNINQQKNELVEGFPKNIKGGVLFIGKQDSINTDGIFAGKHTYNDNLTPLQMKQVLMENYDPKFLNYLKEGDILIAGKNFGTGSSREQAATALKAGGIKLVIASSFSETYKRNAINNGLLVLECPKLIDYFKKLPNALDLPTSRLGLILDVDFELGIVKVFNENDKNMKNCLIQFQVGKIGLDAQKLFLCDGLEAWVKKELNL